jgi:hypothetical protein
VKDDKTTIKGTGSIVVKLLVLTGLAGYGEGKYKLVADLGKQTLIMYGDGLSCERTRKRP